MPSGGHTTVIRRVLERRAQKIPHADDGSTTATVAVMVRVLPPPKALMLFTEAPLRKLMEQRCSAAMLDLESVSSEMDALERYREQFRPLVLTDSAELVRKLRSRSDERAPFILFFAELDEPGERESGLIAGADDCIGRRASDSELDARIANARRIAELEGVLRITLRENRKLSATDDLTRVASRRFFGKHFPREVERAARYGAPLSLLLCDIDHFKKINDSLGHAGGDQILRQFGPRLKQALRNKIDWVARIGGEEFAIVLPETSYERAREVARKLRAAIEQGAFTVDKKKVRVTASFGLCGIDRVPRASRLAQKVLKIADAALYRSKDDGRNRITGTTLEGGDP
jgi:two-component system, cell cycle response regulator